MKVPAILLSTQEPQNFPTCNNAYPPLSLAYPVLDSIFAIVNKYEGTSIIEDTTLLSI